MHLDESLALQQGQVTPIYRYIYNFFNVKKTLLFQIGFFPPLGGGLNGLMADQWGMLSAFLLLETKTKSREFREMKLYMHTLPSP